MRWIYYLGSRIFTSSRRCGQRVYTRNGSLNVNNDRYVVDSVVVLLVYPVNNDGSVTVIDSALPYNYQLLVILSD